MAVDIREVFGASQKEAIAKATIEYGSNFTILTSKERKIGGFLGFGKKNECVLRILLRDSIYERKNENRINENKNSEDKDYEDKLERDGIELNKHKYAAETTETIDGSEMGERIVNMINALKAAKYKNENNVNSSNIQANNSYNEKIINRKIEERENIGGKIQNRDTNDFIPFSNNSYNNQLFGNALLSDSGEENRNIYKDSVKDSFKDSFKDSIDENIKKMIQAQVKEIAKEYLENNIPTANKNNSYLNKRNNLYNRNLSEYRFEEENNARNISSNIRRKRENIDFNENFDRNIDKDYFNDNYSDNKENIEYDNENLEVMDSMEESFNYLRNREFPEEILINLREYLLTSSNARFFQSKEIIREEIEKYFSNKLLFSDGIDIGAKKKIIVFVGPTGVGKTTTIPKIAAQHIRSGRKVSFVTIDNYRIAAVDQLQRYATILKVPFTSANNPEALRAEIRKMDSSSLLFVDTMGRSPKGTEDIISMSKYFSTVGRFDMDIQLVMSSTAKYKDAVKILNAFKPANYKGIILTKVDETDYLASSICAISKTKTPITYVTYGQGVPKDISTAEKYGKSIIESLYGHLK